jgi:hypothetical protein
MVVRHSRLLMKMSVALEHPERRPIYFVSPVRHLRGPVTVSNVVKTTSVPFPARRRDGCSEKARMPAVCT